MGAGPLFLSAAVFNVLVGLPMFIAYPVVAGVLGLQGPPTVWFHIAAGVVVLFGWAYWQIARDPVRFRPYVYLGIVGKLAFAGIIYTHWVAGTATAATAALVTVDVAFALLFIAWLRSHPAAQ